MAWTDEVRMTKALETIAFNTTRIATALEQLSSCQQPLANLATLSETLSEIRFCLGCPGRVSLVTTSEKEHEMFGFKIVFPTEMDKTANTRELSVTIGANAPVVTTFPPDAVETPVDAYQGAEGDAVHIELVDLDKAGNRSKSSVLDAVITDTFPPQQPGQIGLIETSELPDVPSTKKPY